MRLILDADSLVFKSAATTNTAQSAEKNVVKRLHEVEEACFADETTIYVKGRGNYRYNVYPDYKAKRKSSDLDDKMKERLNAAHAALVALGAKHLDGYEADDLCCIEAYKCLETDVDFILGHIDKDLLQIPGKHYDFGKESFVTMEADEADHFFWAQCLEGDQVDNVPGVKGIGPKKAAEILADIKFGHRHKTIIEAYDHHYGKNGTVLFEQYGSALWLLRDMNTTFMDWVATLDSEETDETTTEE